MRVLSVPDWRAGNAYQQLLAEGLSSQGIETVFPSGYRRGMPLWRLCRAVRPDVIHLHWPEAFLASSRSTGYRTWRFPVDLALTCRSTPLVYTAHNLRPHNSKSNGSMNRVYQAIFRNAGAVITHSAGARDTLVKEFPEDTGRFHIIPHGDLSQTLPPLTSRDAARDALKVSSAPFCLMFGAIEPYKGIEEVIRFWNTCSPPLRLVVAGRVSNPDYEKTLRAMAGANPEIEFRFGWLSDSELSHWLSAADVVLFNYRTILTSGAACLARYVGVPVVLPDRLTTVDLDEPHPYVLRFQNLDDSLTQKLREAVHLSRNAAVAEKWRERTSWSEIAKQTAAAYHAALGQR